jgi:SAM-dependent methyltransferase
MAMLEHRDSINRHYGAFDISARILAHLRGAGKNMDALTREDFAAFDEFHGGGREATRTLARLTGLQPGMRVLDVGSGVGGPARTLAAEFGCRVTGLELTQEFCRAAELLTAKVGLTHLVQFRQGDALAVPFDDAAFDVVWSQNSMMNIADKARLLQQVHRVLRSGGCFAFQTMLAGAVPDIHFPVFWADTPALNCLVTPDALRTRLREAGFQEVVWEDTTVRAIAMAHQRRAIEAGQGGPGLGIGVIVPTHVAEKTANALRNYEEGRMVAVQAVYTKTA